MTYKERERAKKHYAHSNKGIVTSGDLNNLESYGVNLITPLNKSSFMLPGLGESANKCGAERGAEMSKEGDAIKYKRLSCRRAACPKCWTLWAKNRVFEIALRIEVEAKIRGERPFLGVMSVDPEEAKNYTWGEVNQRLFKRGYNHAKDIGIKGGHAFFHPFRIKDHIKDKFQDMGIGEGKEDSGYWKDGVREDVLDLGSWYKYVKMGPHAHFIGFGKPEGHEGKDLIISLKDNRYNRPERKNLKEVIGYTFYILTHVGTLNVEGKHNNPTRRFGCCYKKPDMEAIDSEWLRNKKHEIAEAIGMTWTPEDGLETPTDKEEEEDIEWVPIHDLFGKFGKHSRWLEGMPQALIDFWGEVLERLQEGESIYYEDFKDKHPESLEVYRQRPPDHDL